MKVVYWVNRRVICWFCGLVVLQNERKWSKMKGNEEPVKNGLEAF